MLKRLATLAIVLTGMQAPLPLHGASQHQQVHAQDLEANPPISLPVVATPEVEKEMASNAERFAYYKAHPKEYLKAAVAPANLSNWILAVLGVVGGILAGLTVWVIKRQSDLIVAKERARITVEIPYGGLHLEDGPEWTEAMGVVYAGTEIIVTNVGGTHAFNVTARAEIIGTPDVSALGSQEVSVLNLPTVFRSNADPIKVDVITLLKGVDHVASIKGRLELLYLAGTITYDDIFGNSCMTQFRYLWDVGRIDVGVSQTLDASVWKRTDEGNRAT
jgi:hypothetical protein